MEQRDPVARPSSYDKAISVAYLRLLGATQLEAAKAAGLSTATIQRYEICSWWPDILAEAGRRWLAGVTCGTRRGLEKLIEDVDGQTVRWSAERLIPEFAPPTVKTDVTSGGEKLPARVEVVLVRPKVPDDG